MAHQLFLGEEMEARGSVFWCVLNEPEWGDCAILLHTAAAMLL